MIRKLREFYNLDDIGNGLLWLCVFACVLYFIYQILFIIWLTLSIIGFKYLLIILLFILISPLVSKYINKLIY